MDTELEKAEQQILGFTAAMTGDDIVNLSEAMGLTADEWKELRPEVATYMREEDLNSLDEHYA
jgi:hypothetical protein